MECQVSVSEVNCFISSSKLFGILAEVPIHIIVYQLGKQL